MTLVLSLLFPRFVQGGWGEGRHYFKADLRHHTILLQYFVLIFVIQLFIFLSVDSSFSFSEITLGLCPGDDVIKVGSSGNIVLCMVLDGLVFRDPEEDKLAGVKFTVQLLGEPRGTTAPFLACNS